MPDYYQLFSIEVLLRKGKQPAVRELMDEGMRVRGDLDVEQRYDDADAHGFDFDYTWDGPGKLTIYSEERGSIDHAVMFIEELIQKKLAVEPVAVYWANTCSQPRWGEFDGGGVLITREKTYWFIPRQLVDNKWTQIKKDRARPRRRKNG